MENLQSLGLPADLGGFVPDGVLTALVWTSGVLALVGVPLWFVELASLWRQGRLDGQRWRGMLTSAFCLVPYTVVQALVGGAVGLWLAAVWAVAPVQWSVGVGTVVASVLLADLAYYVDHRLSHRIGPLWAFYHSVHHSAEHYDQSVGLRITFLEHVLNVPTLLFATLQVLLGIHPALVLASTVLVLAWQQWIHTETIGALPGLDGWLNTPANHRVHHGSNARYLDANYGGITMIWDRLFGTYVPETEPVRYGLVDPIRSDNPLVVHFGLIPRWWAHVRRGSGVADVLQRLVDPPEAWKAESAPSAEPASEARRRSVS